MGRMRATNSECQREHSPAEAISLGMSPDAQRESELHARAIDFIARGTSLDQCLAQLCRLVEGRFERSVCSSMLVDPETRLLNVCAAPSASEELIEELNGLKPSELSGSCGTCVYLGREVFVDDTATDERWVDLREFATRYGIRSCWSVPVISATGGVLGSFAVSHLKQRTAKDCDRETLRTVAQLAAIAVDRHRLEQERNAVVQSQRLESLGLLAGGIAHDFNNILVGILGNAYFAADEAEPGSALHDSVCKIRRATQHAARLTRQIVNYASSAKRVDEAVDLHRLAGEMAEILSSGTERRVPIRVAEPRHATETLGDAAQLRQVILNLISNAVDASAQLNGTVTVRTGVVQASAKTFADCVGSPALKPGKYAFVEVEDEGIGMDHATQRRAFEPFFSTKGGGRGLGLSATLGILKGHAGALALCSQAGQGTCVRVLLPLSRRESSPVELPAHVARQLSGRILLVDDEEVVLTVMARMLERMGLEVVSSDTADDAVAILRRDATRIDGVILDLGLAGRSGTEAFEALRRVRPDLPILYCSGRGPDEIAELVERDARVSFLLKPFDPATLRDRLSEILVAASEDL